MCKYKLAAGGSTRGAGGAGLRRCDLPAHRRAPTGTNEVEYDFGQARQHFVYLSNDGARHFSSKSPRVVLLEPFLLLV